MPTRFLLPLVSLPVILAGIALSAVAQTQPPGAESSTAARDNTMVESSFTQADLNNDGKLTREEAAKMPAVLAKFDDLDKDKDGMLSLEEFAAALSAAK